MKKFIVLLLSAALLIGAGGCATSVTTGNERSTEAFVDTTVKSTENTPLSTAQTVETLGSQTTAPELSAFEEAYDSVKRGFVPRIKTLNALTLDEYKDPVFENISRKNIYQKIKNSYGDPHKGHLKESGMKCVDGNYYYSEDGRILYFFTNKPTYAHSPKKVAEVREGTEIIFWGAFADEELLEEVILPSSVSFIGGEAFYNCKNLKTIRIDSDKDIFCSYVFQEDYGVLPSRFMKKENYLSLISHLNIPQIINAKEDFVVEDGVLVGYNGIGGPITVPEGVTEIKTGVFSHCRFSITRLDLPSTLNKVGADFIDGGFQLLPVLDFPDGVKELPAETINEKHGRLNCLYVSVAKDCVVAENAIPESTGDEHFFVLSYRD